MFTHEDPMQVKHVTDPDEWENIANSHHAPLPQRWLYGEAVRRIGHSVHRRCVYVGDTPILALQAVARRICGLPVSLTSRGPIGADHDAAKHAMKHLKRDLPPGLALITPETPLPNRLALSTAPEIVDIDLRPEVPQLRASLHGKWRNALRKAENTRLRVARLGASEATLMPLLRAEKQRQSQAKYRALPPEFTLAIQSVAPQSLRLLSASDAQMLFIVHGNSATYHMGVSGPQGRAQNAHNLILWTALSALKDEGVERLDLGTIDRKRAANLARFKCRAGGEVRRLGATYFM